MFLVKSSPLGKTFISFLLNLYLLAKPLSIFGEISTSWQKPLFAPN
jgi:hypothetical protein